jgi:hypothetical protein
MKFHENLHLTEREKSSLSLYSLLTSPGHQDHPIIEFLKSQDNIVSLDLGSEVPLALFALMSQYKNSTCIAVDEDSEHEVIQSFLMRNHTSFVSNEYKKLGDKSKLYDLYLDLFRNTNKELIVSPGSFKKRLLLVSHFETQIADFANLNESNFHIINISNVLHILGIEESEKLLSYLLTKLIENGFIYIRSNYHSSAEREEFKELLYRVFDNGEVIEGRSNTGMFYVKFIYQSTQEKA